MHYRCAKDDEINQVTNLLVDLFYDDIKRISKDKTILKVLFNDAIDHQKTILALSDDNEIAGAILYATKQENVFKFHLEKCTKLFGNIKGKILFKILNREFGFSTFINDEDVYLQIIAVSEKFQRQGIAQKLISECINYTKAKNYYLDVLPNHDVPILVYKKYGFVIDEEIKNIIVGKKDKRTFMKFVNNNH